MTKQTAKQRIEKLRKLIDHYRYLYHVLDKQEISDEAQDSLKKELFDLEQAYPDLITQDSPSQRVAGKPLDKFRKVRHIAPMLSLQDAFSVQDLRDWEERLKKLLTPSEIKGLDYFCELKFDGLAIELVYEQAILKTGSTRGDGVLGEDVTQNLKTIEAIPLKLRVEDDVKCDLKEQGLGKIIPYFEESLKNIVVRGEAMLAKKEFLKINQVQEKAGLPQYANPRNIAAGSIRQLDPNVTAQRRLNFHTWDLISDLRQETHQEEHQILKILGFKVHIASQYCRNLEEVFDFHRVWEKKRESLPFEIDGLVVQVNNNELFRKLGVAGKAPRAAIAFKFSLRQAQTIIEDIKVQVGRTGAITPVAVLRPVALGGVMISRATLHNEDEIERLGLRIGDTAIVGRAGDVIPEVVKVLTELRTGKEKKFKMPKVCPVCADGLKKPVGEAIWRCPNVKCPARQQRYFEHFVGRAAFDIEGLGPKIIDQLSVNNLISDPADLFLLKEGDLLPLERFAEKSAQNLVKAIQAKKIITWPRFLYALGIKEVGVETAYDLSEKFSDPESFQKAAVDDLLKIKDIGPRTAQSIFDFFHNKANLNFLEKLRKVGVKIQKTVPLIEKEPSSLKLQGKTFVLTGSLSSLSRQAAKEQIRALGGDISEAVSQKTDFVVAGENPGSKLAKAKKLGIKLINEKQFLEIIQP